MKNKSGFIHPVIKDKQGKQFTLLGLSNFEEIEEQPVVKLLNEDGIILSVSQESLKKNYSVARRLAINSQNSDSLKELTNLAPVMVYYTGAKYIMMAVVESGTEMLSLYQSLDNGDVFTMRLDEFYDLFSIGYEVAFSARPSEIDDAGGLGYVSNHSAKNPHKFPSTIIRYNGESGTLMAEDFPHI